MLKILSIPLMMLILLLAGCSSSEDLPSTNDTPSDKTYSVSGVAFDGPLYNVAVKAFNSSDVLLGQTTITNTNGSYSILGLEAEASYVSIETNSSSLDLGLDGNLGGGDDTFFNDNISALVVNSLANITPLSHLEFITTNDLDAGTGYTGNDATSIFMIASAVKALKETGFTTEQAYKSIALSLEGFAGTIEFKQGSSLSDNFFFTLSDEILTSINADVVIDKSLLDALASLNSLLKSKFVDGASDSTKQALQVMVDVIVGMISIDGNVASIADVSGLLSTESLTNIAAQIQSASDTAGEGEVVDMEQFVLDILSEVEAGNIDTSSAVNLDSIDIKILDDDATPTEPTPPPSTGTTLTINGNESELEYIEGQALSDRNAFTVTTNDSSFTVSSSNENVATVYPKSVTSPSVDGNTVTVYGASPGTTTITISSPNTTAITYNVEVVDNTPHTLSLSKESITLEEKKTDSFMVTSSDSIESFVAIDPEIVSLRKVGTGIYITALKAGTTDIVISTGFMEARCSVTVTEAVIIYTLSLSSTSTSMNEGTTDDFYISTNDTGVQVSSSVVSVATVTETSNKGTVTASSAGTTVITVTTAHGKSQSFNLTVNEVIVVTPPPEEEEPPPPPPPSPTMSISGDVTTLEVGASDAFSVSATNQTISSVTSSNNSIAVVSGSYTVTAVSQGSVTITALGSSGVNDTFNLTVTHDGIAIVDNKLTFGNVDNNQTTLFTTGTTSQTNYPTFSDTGLTDLEKMASYNISLELANQIAPNGMDDESKIVTVGLKIENNESKVLMLTASGTTLSDDASDAFTITAMASLHLYMYDGTTESNATLMGADVLSIDSNNNLSFNMKNALAHFGVTVTDFVAIGDYTVSLYISGLDDITNFTDLRAEIPTFGGMQDLFVAEKTFGTKGPFMIYDNAAPLIEYLPTSEIYMLVGDTNSSISVQVSDDVDSNASIDFNVTSNNVNIATVINTAGSLSIEAIAEGDVFITTTAIDSAKTVSRKNLLVHVVPNVILFDTQEIKPLKAGTFYKGVSLVNEDAEIRVYLPSSEVVNNDPGPVITQDKEIYLKTTVNPIDNMLNISSSYTTVYVRRDTNITEIDVTALPISGSANSTNFVDISQ